MRRKPTSSSGKISIIASLTQPLNVTDAAHLHGAAAGLAALCPSRHFGGVYLTVLCPGYFLPRHAGAAAVPDPRCLPAARLRTGAERATQEVAQRAASGSPAEARMRRPAASTSAYSLSSSIMVER